MASVSATTRPAVLSDLLPGTWVRDAALVVGAAGLTGAAAQISFVLPNTPVPITLQTFAVLLAGATLGLHRAFLGMALYLALGQLGLPWFAPDGGNATVGYIVGFVVAATVIGHFAAKGADRRVVPTAAMMLGGTAIIYAIAVPWLMVATQMDLGTAISKGVVPFLVADGLKIVAAAGLLPLAWKLVRR